MGLLGVFGVIALRGMIKSNQANPMENATGEAGATPEGAAGGLGGLAEEDSDLAESLKDRFNKSDGPNLRNELSELVESNLDSAADVLKAWIGER